MSYDSEHYYAVQTFLEDDELHKIWNIIEIALITCSPLRQGIWQHINPKK